MAGFEDGFPGGRVPLADAQAEAARTDAYWEWLDGTGAAPLGAPAAASSRPEWDCGRWVRLETPDHADFEARHMRHSIGHSWGRYSGMGEIHSMRQEGAPVATILVAGGVVVHAREERNARLSPEREADMRAFAAARGWTVRDDDLPFDVFADGEGVNTKITYMLRGEGGANSFGGFVAEGRASPVGIAALVAAMGGGRAFLPSAAGLDPLGGAAGSPHEIGAVWFTDEEATDGRGIGDLIAAWPARGAGRAPGR